MTESSDNHIQESRIELFLLSPGEIHNDERLTIEAHLESCSECRDVANQVKVIYGELGDRLASPPTDDDHRLAAQFGTRGKLILGRRAVTRRNDEILDAYAEVVEPTGKWLITRLMRYAVAHPVKSAGGLSLAMLGLVVAFNVLTPSRYLNPTYARISDNVLSVYNQNAEILWTKGVIGSWDATSNDRLAGGKKKLVSVADIDGDGVSEVLLTGADPIAQFSDDTLYCYEHTGKLRWKRGGGRMLAFGKDQYTKNGAWRVLSHFTVRISSESRPRTYVVFEQKPYWPGKVMEIDPLDGGTLQEYWHAGHFTADLLYDVDGDGSEEILLGGINNFYNRAFLAVLDPADLAGHSPLPAGFKPEGLDAAREKYYFLFPRTDLSLAVAGSRYNSVAEMSRLQPEGFNFITDEALGGPENVYGGIIYSFGPDMVLNNIIATDPFIRGHNKYSSEGLLTAIIDDEYYTEVRDSILQWNENTFLPAKGPNSKIFQ